MIEQSLSKTSFQIRLLNPYPLSTSQLRATLKERLSLTYKTGINQGTAPEFITVLPQRYPSISMVQLRIVAQNATVSSLPKTSPSVSSDGIPFLNGKEALSQSTSHFHSGRHPPSPLHPKSRYNAVGRSSRWAGGLLHDLHACRKFFQRGCRFYKRMSLPRVSAIEKRACNSAPQIRGIVL